MRASIIATATDQEGQIRDADLWERISAFELDDPDATLTFSGRLARENGWELEFALRAIEEYKRFMFLLCVSGHPCTPSDEVEQVWHLHLIYTRSYWQAFCGRVLGREIHHGPTLGGAEEHDKFTDQYERTKRSYTERFGHAPPMDLWPPGSTRFTRTNFKRVDLDAHWVLRKPFRAAP